jgi:uncharacterized protein (DUF488 family)
MPQIWTIGHSTRSLNDLIDMLHSQDIQILVDVRSFPGSRKYPHFNKENLSNTIPASGIEYVHITDLGGRRKVNKNSPNTRWRHPSFRGYADYMETGGFENGITQLETMATDSSVCYMCSEAVWWKCHRSMISDFLKCRSWDVCHIMEIDVIKHHKYTQPARVSNGLLTYRENEQGILDFDSSGQ